MHVKMQRQVYLLCSLLLISCVLRVQGQTTKTPAIVFTFTCQSDSVNSIKFTGGRFQNLRLLKGDKLCELGSFDDAGILGCLNKLTVENAATNVTILYEESGHQGTTGGKITKYFLLNCQEKSKIKTAKLTGMSIKKLEHPLENLGHDVSKEPTLTIQGTPTDIYVGMHVTLEMAVDAPYKLLPSTCRAYKKDDDASPYEFWNKCDDNNDKAIISEQLWTAGTRDIKTIATISMYAFRFTEQSAIIIKCDTWVCQLTATECNEICPTSSSIRKRRGANSNLQEMSNTTTVTASVAFDVFERREFRENGSNALSPVWYIYATGFGIIYWITLKNV